MPITQSFAVELLAGESLQVAGPGVVEFSGAEVVRTKLGAIAGAGTGKAVVKTGLNQGAAVTSATTTVASKASVGTIWNGKGLSLGLGMGLGAWGPVILISAATLGGYVYWKKKQAARIWPF